VRVHDAMAQVFLATGNDFASIGAAQEAIDMARDAGYRCPAALLTLARAQRNLGELSLSRASLESALLMADAEGVQQRVLLTLDDDDIASANAELADVLTLIDGVAEKQRSSVDGAERVALREGQILVGGDSLQDRDSAPNPE
jgi:hypothetical protein